MKFKIVLGIIIFVLMAGNVFLGYNYYLSEVENKSLFAQVTASRADQKTLEFTRLFVEKILKSEEEVSFETRLKLENSVRELNDPEILGLWQNFTESKDETAAQENVKNLLAGLVNKIAK